MPKKIDKIICVQCGCQNAGLIIVSDEGHICIDKDGIVTFSCDSKLKQGDTLENIIRRVTSIEDFLGECPDCEDEVGVSINFTDGSQTNDPEQAINDMV